MNPGPTGGFDVRPTVGDRLLSGLGLLCIAASVLWAWAELDSLPERIPIHFNLKGEADDYSGKSGLFGLPIMLSFTWLMLFLISEHMPASQMNLPSGLNEEQRNRAYILSKKLLRFMQFSIGLTCMMIMAQLIGYSKEPEVWKTYSPFVMMAVLIVVIAPVLVYFVVLRKKPVS
ncbi:DUF1648 domain-containing protein [bacterium]|nr:DUF1648 domain-containing protein [bacterium]